MITDSEGRRARSIEDRDRRSRSVYGQEIAASSAPKARKRKGPERTKPRGDLDEHTAGLSPRVCANQQRRWVFYHGVALQPGVFLGSLRDGQGGGSRSPCAGMSLRGKPAPGQLRTQTTRRSGGTGIRIRRAFQFVLREGRMPAAKEPSVAEVSGAEGVPGRGRGAGAGLDGRISAPGTRADTALRRGEHADLAAMAAVFPECLCTEPALFGVAGTFRGHRHRAIPWIASGGGPRRDEGPCPVCAEAAFTGGRWRGLFASGFLRDLLRPWRARRRCSLDRFWGDGYLLCWPETAFERR